MKFVEFILLWPLSSLATLLVNTRRRFPLGKKLVLGIIAALGLNFYGLDALNRAWSGLFGPDQTERQSVQPEDTSARVEGSRRCEGASADESNLIQANASDNAE